MPFLRILRDKRGYETSYLMHWFREGHRQRSRVLYVFRTPGGVRVGRTPLDRETERSYGPSKKPAMEPVKSASQTGSADTTWHARNFLDCVKSHKKCNCDVEEGHLSTAATIIGHIALRTRSLLEWDASRERFTNNEKANRYLSYEYRAPYKLG